jgi:hypothetical protein
MDENIGDFAQREQLEHIQLKVSSDEIIGDELIGQIVAQNFELQLILGQGGMGVVYQARHRRP